MIPNITRGADVRGVLAYLIGKGRREEHKDPHLVAGSPEALGSSGQRELQLRDAGVLGKFIDEPREAFGVEVRVTERDQDGQFSGSREAHVWHCSLSLRPGEPDLLDGRWGEICERLIATMGFAGGDTAAQCRWVAVRHGRSHGGSDHVHLVVGLVAEDGSKASVHGERSRGPTGVLAGLSESSGWRSWSPGGAVPVSVGSRRESLLLTGTEDGL